MAKIRAMIGSGGGGTFRRVVIGTTDSSLDRTFNIAEILPNDYQSLTIDNFALNCKIAYKQNGGAVSKLNDILDSYDATTGVLTCKASRSYETNYAFWISYTVYCCYVVNGGGVQSETVLWTNQNPTSNFASQTITLSQSISNFNYIKFKFKAQTQIDKDITYIIPVADWRECSNNSADSPFALRASLRYTASSTTYYMMRAASYTSDTQVAFGTGTQVNGSYTNASVLLPLEVIGII